MSLPRILVVDDEEEYRDGIRWALHEIFENHVLVFEAVDGKEAVDRVKGGGPPFDVIFMDGRMPQMHGLEAIRRIKPFAPETKIIFIGAMPDDQEEAGAEGAYLLPKTFGVAAVERALRTLGLLPQEGSS